MFPLIGVDSLLNSLEFIVIASNSSQNSSINGPFLLYFAPYFTVFFFLSIIQGGLEQEGKSICWQSLKIEKWLFFFYCGQGQQQGMNLHEYVSQTNLGHRKFLKNYKNVIFLFLKFLL